MVRFSRKTKQQYVAAEKDSKATGWSAFFVDGKWVEGRNNSVSAEFLLKGSRKRPFISRILFLSYLYSVHINDIVVIVNRLLLLNRISSAREPALKR